MAAVLFALARVGRCRLVSSRFAVEEARRNLSTKRQEALARLADSLTLVALVPEADAKTSSDAAATGLDSGDVPILAAAVGRAAALVTGDRQHCGPFMGPFMGALMGAKLLGVRTLSLADALAKF